MLLTSSIVVFPFLFSPPYFRAIFDRDNTLPAIYWLSHVQSDIGDQFLNQNISSVAHNQHPKAPPRPHCHNAVCMLHIFYTYFNLVSDDLGQYTFSVSFSISSLALDIL